MGDKPTLLNRIYGGASRPLQMLFGPELTHTLGGLLLHSPLWRFARPFNGLPSASPITTEVCGVKLPSPLIVAAGLDKNCRFLGQLLDIGFGGAVGGTLTPEPRKGNPKPRLLLDNHSRSIVNALGFPNIGLQKAVSRLPKLATRRQRVLVSISGDSPDQFGECYRTVSRHCGLVELNISSPNTPALRSLCSPTGVRAITKSLGAISTPLLLKLPRVATSDEWNPVLELANVALANGVAGVVACNTLPVAESRVKAGKGGLSGAPLFESTLQAVEKIKHAFGSTPVVACGGVSTAQQVLTLLDAGAVAVQLYTALVYSGPSLPAEINRALVRRSRLQATTA